MLELRAFFISGRSRLLRFYFVLVAFVLVLLLAPAISAAFSQPSSNGYWSEVRAIPAADLGLTHPIGLTYSPSANLFFALESSGANLITFTPFEDRVGANQLGVSTPQPLNAAFYGPTGELFALDQQGQELAQVQIGPQGDRPLSSQVIRQFSAGMLRIANPQGMTFDADHGRLFALDAARPGIIRIQADAQNSFDGEAAAREGRVQRIQLPSLENVALRGIAFNPSNGHLYVASPAQRKIYELTDQGQIVSVLDLTELNLRDPQGMVFAPSGDRTDDPTIFNLYLADSGLSSENPHNGRIVELSFQALPMAGLALNAPASLVNTIDTSKPAWNPSSPDPSGIAYRPASNRLFVTDAEVEENHPDYQGFNVFESTTGGNLTNQCSTTDFSNEPTGAAVNPSNGRIYITDDFRDDVFEINLVDGIYCNGNDAVATLDLRAVFNLPALDPEGVGYGANKLFIGDGLDAELRIVDLGNDGVVGGSGGASDTNAGHFDTASLGIGDPEGVEYNPDNNTIFISSQRLGDKIVVETTLSGAVVNTYDLDFLGSVRRSGLAYGPSSVNPGVNSLYIASRGVDNDSDPNENDGKIYELALGDGPPPPTPTPTPPPPSGEALYVSLWLNKVTTVGTLSGVGDEDIIFFNGSAWSMHFDGSDVAPASADLDAFHIVNANTILMSFDATVSISGIGSVRAEDVVQFNATSLGNNTAGSFSFFFDGGDVGLTTADENVDAIDQLADGRVLISTFGNVAVTGVSGQDKDILAFTPTSLGTNTSGTWAMYFDGSDVGLTTAAEDIDALDVIGNGNIYLSTSGAFAVTGVSGQDEDVFVCNPTSIGDTTACNYSSTIFFDGTPWLVTKNDVDAINLP